MINEDTVFIPMGIENEWLAEYNRRSAEVNKVYDAINSGELTEQGFTIRHRELVREAMEMNILMFDSDTGVGLIKKGQPMVEGVDYVIETRNGEFGVYFIE